MLYLSQIGVADNFLTRVLNRVQEFVEENDHAGAVFAARSSCQYWRLI
jgi:hypothetical protein